MEILNQYSGLFALLAVVAAVVVPVVLYKKQKKDAALAEQKRKQERILEERQEQLDWKEAVRRAHNNPFPIFEGSFEQRVKNAYKEVRSERILGRKDR